MAAPLKIRFATDTAGAKAGAQDLAASIVSNIVKVTGAASGMGASLWKGWGEVDKVLGAFNGSIAQSNAGFSVLEKNAGAFSKLASAQGGYAAATKKVASTIAADTLTIGSAAVKAAKDHNLSLSAIGIETVDAARKTKTGTAAMSAAWEVGTAPIAFKAAFIRNEIAGVMGVLARSPTFVGLAGGIALYAALTVASNRARDAVAEYQEISGKSRDLGVGASFLQRWLGEAKELNIEAAKLEEMLKKARDASMTKLGEDGKESGSEIGERLGLHVKAGNLSKGDLVGFNAAQTEEGRYRAILGLIEKLQAKGMQLAALDVGGKMFGPEFENKMRAGVDMVGRMKATLDSTSQTAGGKRIISDEELRNADQIAAQTERINRLLADSMAPIQRDIMLLGQQQYRGWLDIGEAIAGVIKKASALYNEIKPILAMLDKLTTADPMGALATKLGAQEIRQLLGLKPPENTEAFGPDMPAGFRVTVNPKKDNSKSLPKTSGSGEESEDAVERLIKQLEKANDTARAEFETVGKTNVEREKAVAMAKAEAAAREAGRSLTSEEVSKIQEAAEMTAVWKDKTKDLEQAQRQAAEAMRSFGQMGADAFADMLLEGKSFEDTLKSLEKQIVKMALNAAFTGSGPLSGILGLAAPASAGANASGGLIGALSTAFRANGGPVSAGRAYTVGEMGREIFVPSSDGRVVPIGRGGAGGGGGVSLTVNNSAGADIQPTFRQSSNGDIEMIVDVVTRRQARDAGRGRGEFARAGLVDQRLRG